MTEQLAPLWSKTHTLRISTQYLCQLGHLDPQKDSHCNNIARYEEETGVVQNIASTVSITHKKSVKSMLIDINTEISFTHFVWQPSSVNKGFSMERTQFGM